MSLYYEGLIIGLVAFFMIGIFHPIVIKVEYYWGKKVWPYFALVGVLFCILSIFIENKYLSICSGVLAFSLFWSVKELFEQHKRVVLGRAKKNPKRKY